MRPTRFASVLVVDDDPGVRLLLAAALRDVGYRVITAGSGAEALGTIAVESPDLVLTDHQMPAMTGVQLFVTLRSGGFTAPIVLMSAGTNARAEAIAYGLDAYLSKPMDLDTLLKVVADQLAPETRLAGLLPQQPSQEALPKPRVMVINASADLLQLLGATVEEAGFEAILLTPGELGKDVPTVQQLLRRHNPKVVVYDVSAPYPANWSLFCDLRDAERLDGSGRQFIATTPNKQALEERIGATAAIELVGDHVNRTAIARVISRAAVGPDVCC
jgi:CheY-like chemotaxis protein